MNGVVLAAAGIILAGGAQQIGDAALTVLADIAMGIGAWVMLCVFLYLLALGAWRARRPGGHADTQPMREIDEAVAEFGHDLDKEIDDMLREGGR